MKILNEKWKIVIKQSFLNNFYWTIGVQLHKGKIMN
jgi:hypothetical protein